MTLDNWGQPFKFLLFYIMQKLRLAVVFFPNRKIFTLRRLYYIMGVMIIVALCLMTFSQLLSPCCRYILFCHKFITKNSVTPDFHFYSYSYFFFENQTENLSLYFVDGPLDFSTSVICATSYCAVGSLPANQIFLSCSFTSTVWPKEKSDIEKEKSSGI